MGLNIMASLKKDTSGAKGPTRRKTEIRTKDNLKTMCSTVKVKWCTPMAMSSMGDGKMVNLLMAPVSMRTVIRTQVNGRMI